LRVDKLKADSQVNSLQATLKDYKESLDQANKDKESLIEQL